MKKSICILFFFSIIILAYTQDSSSDYNNINYLPRVIKAAVFEKEILNNITSDEDKNQIMKCYYLDAVKINYYLKVTLKKDDLLILYNIIYSYKDTHEILALEKAKYIHENEQPVFSQKSGMLRPGDHSFYFRTDDEWTGFSTHLFDGKILYR